MMPAGFRNNRNATPAEFRLWAIQRMAPDTAAYNVERTWRLQGPVSRQRLESSIDRFIQDNPSLNNVFITAPGDNTLTVAHGVQKSIDTAFAFNDVSDYPYDRARARAVAAAERFIRYPFDLEQGPLYKIQLCKIAPDEHLLTFCAHHIIFDGRSFAAFMNVLKSALDEMGAYSGGRTRQIATVVIATPKFQAGYWGKYLNNAPALSTLAPDYRRSENRRYKGERQAFHFSQDTAKNLRVYCTEARVTLPTLLLNSYGYALSSLTGQKDLVIAVPMDMRSGRERDLQTVGFKVNTLPVRLSVTGDFREDMKRVGTSILSCLRRKHDSLDDIIDCLRMSAPPGMPLLMQTMFNYFETYDRNVFGDVRLDVLDMDPRQSMYDLSLVVESHPSGLSFILDYDVSLYKAATIQTFIDAFRHVIAAHISPTAAITG